MIEPLSASWMTLKPLNISSCQTARSLASILPVDGTDGYGAGILTGNLFPSRSWKQSTQRSPPLTVQANDIRNLHRDLLSHPSSFDLDLRPSSDVEGLGHIHADLADRLDFYASGGVAVTLSKPRKYFLEILLAYGGTLTASQLTVPDRRLATMMQSDGLVEWFGGSSRHTCIGQSVRITPAGRNALAPTTLTPAERGDDT